jgi:hypothetical protein
MFNSRILLTLYIVIIIFLASGVVSQSRVTRNRNLTPPTAPPPPTSESSAQQELCSGVKYQVKQNDTLILISGMLRVDQKALVNCNQNYWNKKSDGSLNLDLVKTCDMLKTPDGTNFTQILDRKKCKNSGNTNSVSTLLVILSALAVTLFSL